MFITAIRNLMRRLFGKKPDPQAGPPRQKGGKRLTQEDRRHIEAAITRARGGDKKELSAQDSIPYQRMYPDGICRITDTFYTRTVQFQDINYQLSQNEDKTAIFEGWSDFLNYFDSSIRFQLSFLNLSAAQDGTRTITIPLRADQFNDVRGDYSTMLENQLAKGNNGLAKTKFLTFGIDADSLKTAKPRLERIEMDIIGLVRGMGLDPDQLAALIRAARPVAQEDSHHGEM